MNDLGISTIILPFHTILMEGSSVTSATTVASRFSSSAAFMNLSRSAGCTTTAILSCDSEMAISVPSRPSYFFGTASRLILRPSASSPMATDTPPAPKSLHLMMSFVTSGFLNSLWSFLSVGALPFCTSDPQVITDFVSCAFDEPVAPPIPSRPVLPPRRTTMSPAAGLSRTMLEAGAAPTTAPISILFAT